MPQSWFLMYTGALILIGVITFAVLHLFLGFFTETTYMVCMLTCVFVGAVIANVGVAILRLKDKRYKNCDPEINLH